MKLNILEQDASVKIVSLTYICRKYLRPKLTSELCERIDSALRYEQPLEYERAIIKLDCRNPLPKVITKNDYPKTLIKDLEQLLKAYETDHHIRFNLAIDSDLPINLRTKLLKLRKKFPTRISFTTHAKRNQTFHRLWMRKSKTDIVFHITRYPGRKSISPDGKTVLTTDSALETWVNNAAAVHSCCYNTKANLFLELDTDETTTCTARRMEIFPFIQKLLSYSRRLEDHGCTAMTNVKLCASSASVLITPLEALQAWRYEKDYSNPFNDPFEPILDGFPLLEDN